MAKRDIHQEITNKIIELIEQRKAKGAGKLWDNPNGITLPTNAATGKPYSGINSLVLMLVADTCGYPINKWVTFKQAQANGWKVKKGEKSTRLCFYSQYTKKTDNNNDDDSKQESYFFAKGFNVFNVSQLEGYTDDYKVCLVKPTPNHPVINLILSNTDVTMLPEGGNKAFYAPSKDAIQMPPKKCFSSEAAYTSVLLHELTHSTMHKSRLDRVSDYKNKFANYEQQYAAEELVAELGAAFLSATLGLEMLDLECHACYLDHYLNYLKKDKKAIFKASADAQKACNWIMENWAAEQVLSAEAA